MPILLGSGGYRTPERIALLREQMRSFFGSIRRLVFVPYALADHDGYIAKMYERGLDAGYKLLGLHTFADPVRAVEQAEGIYVGGGRFIDAPHTGTRVRVSTMAEYGYYGARRFG